MCPKHMHPNEKNQNLKDYTNHLQEVRQGDHIQVFLEKRFVLLGKQNRNPILF